VKKEEEETRKISNRGGRLLKPDGRLWSSSGGRRYDEIKWNLAT